MKARLVTGLCLFALVLEGYDILMFGLVVPSLIDYKPWSLQPGEIGWLGSIAAIGMLVGALVAALFGDRVRRRTTLLAAISLFSLAMVTCAAASSYELFMLGRFGIGLGAGMLMPTAAAAIVEFAPASIRNRAVTIGFAGTCVGGILAGLVSLWIVPAFGFRGMFWVGAVPAIILLPLIWRAFPHEEPKASLAKNEHRRTGVAEVFETGGVRTTLGFWLAMALCLLLVFGVATWLPKLMQSAGYSLAAALSFLLTLNIGALAGTFLGGWLADRFGIRPVTVGAFLLGGLSLLGLATAPATPIAYALVLLAGAGTTGTQILLNAFVAAYYPASCRSAGVGLALGVGRLGAIAGPSYGATIISLNAGYAWQLIAFAIAALLGSAVVMTLIKSPSPVDSEDVVVAA